MTGAPALPAAVMRVMRFVASVMFWLLLRVGRRSERRYRTSAGCQPLDAGRRNAAGGAAAILLAHQAELLVELLLALQGVIRLGRLDRVLEPRHHCMHRQIGAVLP